MSDVIGVSICVLAVVALAALVFRAAMRGDPFEDALQRGDSWALDELKKRVTTKDSA